MPGDKPTKSTIKKKDVSQVCEICGCALHRRGGYATPTAEGRSHATEHHYVAERFFGRSKNRKGSVRVAIFDACPWNLAKKTALLCYDCHEELVHNLVFLPQDISAFADLVNRRNLDEKDKSDDKSKLAGRIVLLHEVLQAGLKVLKSR